MPKYANGMGDALRCMKQAVTMRERRRRQKMRDRSDVALTEPKEAIGRQAAGIGHELVTAPDRVLAERERRQALEPRSLTAALLGDPLPGYSALDKRKPHLVVDNG